MLPRITTIAAVDDEPMEELPVEQKDRPPSPCKPSPLGNFDVADSDAMARERLQLVQIYLLTSARGIFQMARICMGPLVVSMSAEYRYSSGEKGKILSAFAAGYAWTQILGGLAADKFGGKPLMLLGLLSSGGSLLALPFIADKGVSWIWWLLWAMGVMQGPTYPAQIVTTAKWATGNLRSYASALGGAGSTAGSFLALGLTPVLAERIGWRMTSWFFGVATIFFGLVEACFASSAPHWEGGGSPKRSTSNTIERPTGGIVRRVQRWCMVLLTPSVLAIFTAHSIHNFVRYFLMAWMPTYYSDVLNISADAAGLHLVTPELCGLISSIAGASVGRDLQTRGALSPLNTRRVFASIAFLGSFSGLLVVSSVSNAASVTLFLCLVQGLATLQGLGFGANYLEISKYHGGLVTGVGNTVATCASFFAPLFASWLIPSSGQRGPQDWQRLFLAFACSNLVGLFIYIPLCSTTPVDVEENGKSKAE